MQTIFAIMARLPECYVAALVAALAVTGWMMDYLFRVDEEMGYEIKEGR